MMLTTGEISLLFNRKIIDHHGITIWYLLRHSILLFLFRVSNDKTLNLEQSAIMWIPIPIHFCHKSLWISDELTHFCNLMAGGLAQESVLEAIERVCSTEIRGS
jgi:hypothetical protein